MSTPSSLLWSRAQDSLAGIDGFRFEAVPNGLPQSDNDDVTQDIAALCLSTTEHSAAPFRDLLARLNATPGSPPVSCVIADGVMSFAQLVAEEMGILAHQCVRLHGVPPLRRAHQTRLRATERYISSVGFRQELHRVELGSDLKQKICQN